MKTDAPKLPILRDDPSATPVEVSELREVAAGSELPAQWRSLEELADTAIFRHELHRDLPGEAMDAAARGVGRRQFLQLAAGSATLGALAACTKQPPEKIIPYVQQPEQLVPGRPLHFATTLEHEGYGIGVLAESHMGRPTKVEGNPEHPSSLGACDLRSQASINDLFDPDRPRTVTHRGEISSWNLFLEDLRGALTAQKALGGAGLRILTGTLTSPSLAADLRAVLEQYPEARWHQWQAVGRDHERSGTAAAFGGPFSVRYELKQAEVILSLDADFLTEGPGHLRYARDFAASRRDGSRSRRMYSLESTPSNTGTMADHRRSVKPSHLLELLLALAARLGVEGSPSGASDPWVEAVASDFESHRGAGLVVAGESLPPEAHTLVHGINGALGNLGRTVLLTDPVEAEPVDHLGSLQELHAAMSEGRVDLLLLLGVNPVYDAPADLDFAEALSKVPLRVHHSFRTSETSDHCHWHVPATHALESWGDLRAHDGSVSFRQPLMQPLFGGHSVRQLLAVMCERAGTDDLELLRAHWREAWGEEGFEEAWRKAVHDGTVADSALPPLAPELSPEAVSAAASALATPAGSDEIELALRPDPAIYDGRHANNGWLQECPRPFTRLTWDNAALIAPRTAEGRGIRNGDVLELSRGDQQIEIPAWILPGQPEGVVTVHLGYGRAHSGRVGNGAGVSVNPLRTSAGRWGGPGLAIRRVGTRRELASTQHHHLMESQELESREAAKRHLVRHGTLEQFEAHPRFVQEIGHQIDPEINLLPGFAYDSYAWGMVIDLSACTGCNACLVACQAENNIPVVGREQIARGREMHWIRIDRYFEGDLDDPTVHHQPVACQQCEQAPCEIVCPVGATVHSAEGLNDMVYNRCVGTRYCSNNCPYKVRRFNFFLYADFDDPVLELGRNPDVTVRSRGVMEKCTYCVQRISKARIDSKRERRSIRDGEVVTACQQSCPSEAIHFGDLNDPDSAVSRRKNSPLDYSLLTELNTRPRTTYLAKLRNPNPALEGAKNAH